VSYPLENALFQWEDGWRDLQAITDQKERRLAERVVDAMREELRRRIGATFSASQLADLYGEGTEWALGIAGEIAPVMESRAQSLADAAFWTYVRGAGDFAGGRQLLV
jgi:hypothetical protein